MPLVEIGCSNMSILIQVKSATIVIGEPEGSSVPALISGFCSMKRLGVFLLPLNGILVHRRYCNSA